MRPQSITVVARIKAKVGREEDVKKELTALIAPTRLEPGCLKYDLHQSSEDKSLFMFYENWAARKDLDEHLKMPYLQEFLGKAEKILAEPVEIALWEMIV